MSTPDPFLTYDAAYVLGALSPQDRAAYDAHLLECDRCARAVRELAGMPGLLGQAQAGPSPVAESPPASLLPALLDRVARARRRRRLTVASTAGLALAACLALLLVLVSPGDQQPGGSPQTEPIAMTSVVSYPVEATLRLAEADWGTRVEMDCRYGVEESNEYVLVAITREGGAEQLATWLTVPDHTVSLSVGTALRRDDIESLEVRSTHGYTVLQADVPVPRG